MTLTFNPMTPYETYANLISVGDVARTNYIAMGEYLMELRANDKWKEAVGEGVTSWSAFLKQPEIGISVGEATKLMKIYNRLGDYDVSDISLANLKKLVDIENITEEIIDQARTLSDRDFKEALAENDNITERTYTYIVMKKCNETDSMRKVHDISSDLIKDTFNLDD